MNSPELSPRFPSADRVFVIAEIGTSHQGDPVKAEELIDAAAESGADCAKFQMVIADEILHPETGAVVLPGGAIPLYKRFREMERDASFYLSLKERVEKRGMVFLCTPFGIASARALRSIGVSLMKIASPELNHIPLLDEIAGYGLPVILSSGVSRLSDIEEAVDRFPGRATLLHCVTSYPAPEEEYNLSLLPELSALLGLPVGVSDHSVHPLIVPLTSVAVGGSVIEKHFPLSRSTEGLDDPIALPPSEFAAMTSAIRRWEAEGKDGMLEGLQAEFGRERIGAVLGAGVKKLAPSESAHYGRTNRSIIALKDIERGEPFNSENCGILRSEKNIQPGIHPRYLPLIIGRPSQRAVPSATGITWDDVLPPPVTG